MTHAPNESAVDRRRSTHGAVQSDFLAGTSSTRSTAAQRGVVNNLKGQSLEQHVRVAETWLALEQEFGPDPARRQQAAAHEASHALVAHAIGFPVTSTSIWQIEERGRTIWVGATDYSISSAGGAFAVPFRELPFLALKSAIANWAGIAGEVRAKLAHQSSAVDERILTEDQCAELDELLNRPRGASMTVATTCAGAALSLNAALFDKLRGMLHTRMRLEGQQLQTLLAGVQPINVADYMGRFP